ncbi:hypothetical protein Xmau_04091 [Xenorhabdus mauleonii]|uniref:Uncharacterized protein n=1 Tax=Xenorhabdus mauleonii TaxID=351675 RepID=A0A1I3VVW5_9GAMM|nr:hypothetical protein [Xenorhabdus mauleonii]PHM36941.1 hypothetical protein Xmau_04091 [Xenorhabdus mauleonii]SFJ99279.1 hypothetical protein SAMN05421680_1233 [Xenorhabdus mauleonii]
MKLLILTLRGVSDMKCISVPVSVDAIAHLERDGILMKLLSQINTAIKYNTGLFFYF